jgi:hypothetical protein
VSLTSGLFQTARYCGIGVVAGTPFADPILPNDWHVVPVFPPLGGTDLLLKSFASLVILACSVLATRNKRRSGRVKYRRGFSVALAGLAFYVALVVSFVVRIDNPYNHTYEFRSIGFLKTELGKTDPDLKNAPPSIAIQVVGTDEGHIETVWEPWSIFVVRFLLFVSYLVTLGSLNYAFGAVKIDINDASSV